MEERNNQNFLGESGSFFAEEEQMEDDLFRTCGDLTKKTGEISDILANCSRKLREWGKEKKELKSQYQILYQKYQNLGKKLEEMNEKQDRTNRERDKLAVQLEECRAREEQLKKAQEDYSRYYNDARADKEKAEADLKRCLNELLREKEHSKELQAQLEKEAKEKEAKEGQIKEQERQLQEKDKENGSLREQTRQYELQSKKMPALTRLYDAYHCIQEKKDGFPQEFSDCLQSVVPSDDFERFVSMALEPSFPISLYMATEAFAITCSRSEKVSEETLKEALQVLDGLLSGILAFGSKYFEEKRFSPICIEAGDSYDKSSCIYLGESGNVYGKIKRVWLHGFKDEKKNEVYCSYVEGE